MKMNILLSVTVLVFVIAQVAAYDYWTGCVSNNKNKSTVCRSGYNAIAYTPKVGAFKCRSPYSQRKWYCSKRYKHGFWAGDAPFCANVRKHERYCRNKGWHNTGYQSSMGDGNSCWSGIKLLCAHN